MSENMASPREHHIKRFFNVTANEIEYRYHAGSRPPENSAGAAT